MLTLIWSHIQEKAHMFRVDDWDDEAVKWYERADAKKDSA